MVKVTLSEYMSLRYPIILVHKTSFGSSSGIYFYDEQNNEYLIRSTDFKYSKPSNVFYKLTDEEVEQMILPRIIYRIIVDLIF